MATWDEVATSVSFTLPIDLTRFRQRVPTSSRVLDLGCGYGRLGALLHGHGYADVQGYDTSQEMIARGRREHPQLPLAQYAGGRVPEPDASFDAAILCALLTSIPEEAERTALMQELLRLLKPGAVLHAAEFLRTPAISYSASGTFVSRQNISMKHYERPELLALFAGFEQLEVTELDVASLSGAPMAALHYFGRKRGCSALESNGH